MIFYKALIKCKAHIFSPQSSYKRKKTILSDIYSQSSFVKIVIYACHENTKTHIHSSQHLFAITMGKLKVVLCFYD